MKLAKNASLTTQACDKKEMTIDLKKKCIEQIPGLLKDKRRIGRILEEAYKTLGRPVDTSSDGIEHPLSSAFVTQHHRQRATIMTNPTLMGDFAAAQQQMNAATLVHENVRVDQVENIDLRCRRINCCGGALFHRQCGTSG